MKLAVRLKPTLTSEILEARKLDSVDMGKIASHLFGYFAEVDK